MEGLGGCGEDCTRLRDTSYRSGSVNLPIPDPRSCSYTISGDKSVIYQPCTISFGEPIYSRCNMIALQTEKKQM